ncbi:MAG: FKBP-type peptidyl-prolyl cis-trans isomerase, partial [Betaproteobacteria bacterium]|nr:FKBP-type peptidyl-prolyl cis-trans isomerase [Betaproteobacteria bacterium]
MQRGRGDVQYEDILVGDGEIAQRGGLVEIQYTLSLNHGDIVQRDQLYEFRIGEQQVVAGLEYGVEGMRVGGQRHIR